jgi:hypothetical protein
MAFQFASTNLVWELGLVLQVLIGWQFALGLVMIGLIRRSEAYKRAPRSRRAEGPWRTT